MSQGGGRSPVGDYLKSKAARKLVMRVGKAKLAAAAGLGALAFVFGLALLALLVGGGATPSTARAAMSCRMAGGENSPPRWLQPIYQAASVEYGLGPRGPSFLAAINKVETSFGENLNVSSAGALGWMQFMPETWEAYGVDADEDGARNPNDPEDAIFAAANYLSASGFPQDIYGAVFAYNHADWYVEEVEHLAESYSGAVVCTPTTGQIIGNALVQRAQTLRGPHAFKAIPARLWVGYGPPQAVDSRIWLNVIWVLETFDLRVTAARESGHETHGDGTAIDIVAREGRGWDETARQAAETLGWRESCAGSGTAPACPIVPAIQFVGYNGYDSMHGDPAHAGDNAHLHISWQSSSFGSGALSPPPDWVRAFPVSG